MSTSQSQKEIFLVYGRNRKIYKAMVDFLRAIDLKPKPWSRVLADTGEGSPSTGDAVIKGIINAPAVLVLLTPDEMVWLRPVLQKPNDPEAKPSMQPRPNVFYEAGAADIIDRKKTVYVQIGEVRLFSDISGRQMINFSGDPKSRVELATRLKSLGLDVDMNNTDAFEDGGEFAIADIDIALLSPMAVLEYSISLGNWRVTGIKGEVGTLTGDAGQTIADGTWQIETPQGGKGFFGPYINLRPGQYRAIFRLKIDDNTGPDMHLVNLDVSSHGATKRLAQRTLTVRDFTHSDKFQEFPLDFEVLYEENERYEFRLRTDPSFVVRKQLTLDYVELRMAG